MFGILFRGMQLSGSKLLQFVPNVSADLQFISNRNKGDEGCTKMWKGGVLGTKILQRLSALDTAKGKKSEDSLGRTLKQSWENCGKRTL